MRLDRFWIGEFKNLKDVTIDFDEEHWVTVVIGWNGTGKSNALEAMVLLFRDFILGENEQKEKNKPSFSYCLTYQCRNNIIHIDAEPKRAKDAYRIHVRSAVENNSKSVHPDNELGKKIALSNFLKEQDKYLPKYVFGYYSGNSDRMQEVFRKYLARYDRDLRGGKDPGLRRLFYALPVHSQFVLLAFVLQQDQVVKDFLINHLGLDSASGIDSVLFVLRQPPWRSNAKDGDYRFWNARGVVKDFLVRLYDIALAPVRINRRVDATLWNKPNREFLYLYVKDLKALEALVGQQTPKEFFRDLESTYVSELIEEVRIRVKLRHNDGSVTFRELSEGEQQLLTVLGLLRFTSEEESLFLLDEPDTHLNPRWSVDYLDYLQKFVGSNQASRESSHILLATHNPLSIAELVKEQVQVLKRDMDTLSISVDPPETDPRGMGYAGIVTSDMFGLAAALDGHTLKLLERKRVLTLKEKPLNKHERQELENINLELEPYGFRHEARDPLFREYLMARFEYEKEQQPKTTSQLSSSERRSIAVKLIKEIKNKTVAK